MKINKGEIFKTAWRLVKGLGVNLSIALKLVWAKINSYKIMALALKIQTNIHYFL